MRQLTLEEEEEEEEVQRRCEEKSPSAAMEDPGPGGLHADPTDSKTLQGTALGVEVLLSRRRRLTCAALLLTRPLAGRETALALAGRCPALWSHLRVFPMSHVSPGPRGPSCTARQGFSGSDFSVREVLLLAGWDPETCCLLWGQPSVEARVLESLGALAPGSGLPQNPGVRRGVTVQASASLRKDEVLLFSLQSKWTSCCRDASCRL